MAGRSTRDRGNENGGRRLKGGFVLLVGFSGGMIALQAGASPLVVVAATIAGFLAGFALLWYMVRIW